MGLNCLRPLCPVRMTERRLHYSRSERGNRKVSFSVLGQGYMSLKSVSSQELLEDVKRNETIVGLYPDSKTSYFS